MEGFSLAWIPESVAGVLGVLACVLLLSSYVPRWWMYLKYRRLPPGPFCWPLIGYVPTLSVAAVSDRLSEVSAKFGGIFGFFVGCRYVLFIDDFQALKEAFGREEFLARPPGVLSTSPDQSSIAEESGENWRKLKRFWRNSTRVLGVNNEGFRSAMASELSLLVQDLEKTSGEDVDVCRLLEHQLFNLSFSFAYGKTFERGHRMFDLVHEYSRAWATCLSFNTLKYIFPWIGQVLILLSRQAKTKACLLRFENILSQEVKEHQQTLNPNEPRDFVDLFLIHMQKPGTEHVFNVKSLVANTIPLIEGFIISICTTMEWFLLNMAAQPDVQTAIQEVIDSVIGREREPLLTDRPQIPLLDAAIMESARCRYIGPVVGFRSVLKDTTLKGYDIPKNTMVFYNAAGLCRNPKYWPEPDRYDPNRFLSEDGMSLRVPDHFIPYGVGKRTSLGESTSGPVTFLIAAHILQKYQILPPDGGISLDKSVNIVNKPAHPFVKFQKRF